jgi:hypothetical protein
MSISSVGNVTMKETETSDDTPMTLLLQTGEIDIVADDVLGKIQFQAPDEAGGTDAILVAAEIAAVSEGTFAADNNATKLSFMTGASEAASEKMSLSSGGDLELSSADAGAASGPTFTLSRDSASPAVDDFLGNIKFIGKNDADPAEDVVYAEIQTIILDETDGTEDGQINFKIMRAGSVANPIVIKEDEVELNAADIDINGDVLMTNAYTLNLSNLGTNPFIPAEITLGHMSRTVARACSGTTLSVQLTCQCEYMTRPAEVRFGTIELPARLKAKSRPTAIFKAQQITTVVHLTNG